MTINCICLCLRARGDNVLSGCLYIGIRSLTTAWTQRLSGSIADVHQQQLNQKSGSPLPGGADPSTSKAQEQLKMGSEALTEGRYKDDKPDL